MVDLEVLSQRARRAGELGRLRAAARVAPFVVAVCAIACAAHRGALARCIVLGIALLAAVVGCRFSGRRVGAAAWSGFVAGAVPALALALLVRACGADGLWECGLGCGLAGFAAAAFMALRHHRDLAEQPSAWLALAATATLMTTLGCLSFGRGAVLAVLAVVAAGALSGYATAAAVRASR